MSSNSFDARFYQAALDGLKAYGRIELTKRFIKKQKVPTYGKKLSEMWASIENWMDNDESRCRTLWEYVDDLRQWGRQRIFLYEVEESYAAKLSNSTDVKGIVRGVYYEVEESYAARPSNPTDSEEIVGSVHDEPVFEWEADDPFVASVKHTVAQSTGDPLLVFKLIENRKYNMVIDDKFEPAEERSTNFFIINLQNRHAELRIQELPTGAVRDVLAERDQLEAVIGKYLDMKKFDPINLAPVMDVMLRVPIFDIMSSRLNFTEPAVKPNAPALVAFLNKLFRRPDPAELTARWVCNQKILGKNHLRFELSAASSYVRVGGIAEPDHVSDLIEKLVDIERHPSEHINRKNIGDPAPPSIFEEGIIAKTLIEFKAHPEVQAVILSAGVIAATIIWIIADALGSYAIDKVLERILGGLPTAVIIVPIEIAWNIFYYGWKRIWRGFKMLCSLSMPEVWKAFNEARKRRGMEKEIVSDYSIE